MRKSVSQKTSSPTALMKQDPSPESDLSYDTFGNRQGGWGRFNSKWKRFFRCMLFRLEMKNVH